MSKLYSDEWMRDGLLARPARPGWPTFATGTSARTADGRVARGPGSCRGRHRLLQLSASARSPSRST